MKFIEANWPAPSCIQAFSTTRLGGVSEGLYRGLNIANHVGDSPEVVSRNRSEFAQSLPRGCAVQWLSQEHGSIVVEARRTEGTPSADACWSADQNVACAIMSADCLPVLFCTRDGQKVAAAHAGWRGLAGGVLEATVTALADKPERLLAWLGPAIGPEVFEVGPEVREQFISGFQTRRQDVVRCFKPSPEKSGFYLADLYQLARIRLRRAGVVDIFGDRLCTFADSQRFYSYRRDGQTGRMATVVVKTAS